MIGYLCRTKASFLLSLLKSENFGKHVPSTKGRYLTKQAERKRLKSCLFGLLDLIGGGASKTSRMSFFLITHATSCRQCV